MNHHHHHHHHHVALVARISLTLYRHSFLSFIALCRSSVQHPVSSHSCWIYVRAGRPAFARPCVVVHKSTFLMSSSLLLQQCSAYLVRLTWIVFVIGGRWPYSWCLVGCCRQELFKIARRSFDSIRRGKMEQILLAYGIPKETVAAITILYRNTKVKVRSPDGDTEYFDIVAGVLQGDTLAPYLFIICLDYVLRTSIDKIRENGFELTKKRSWRYPAKTITDADFWIIIICLHANIWF